MRVLFSFTYSNIQLQRPYEVMLQLFAFIKNTKYQYIFRQKAWKKVPHHLG